ncbi:MFS transporter [Streptomyces sp. NPDC048331]|uniref:MFS transporter n=1 Tax=Streptomyces sp. NPDC048331 TaxID=3365534 RepID=UPI00372489C0
MRGRVSVPRSRSEGREPITGRRGGVPGGAGPGRQSLRGERPLATYLVGESTSLVGTSVHAVALPVVAVLYLHASATETTWLYLLGQLPNLICTLPAGALADRYPTKRLLIGADLASAGLVALIPVAAAAGVLSVPMLAGVALLLGAVTVLRQAAACTILPQLVAPSLLHRATAVQEAASGASSTGARSWAPPSSLSPGPPTPSPWTASPIWCRPGARDASQPNPGSAAARRGT